MKGNRLSAKTKIKSIASKSPVSRGRKTDMTSELDMFNSNIQNISKKSVDYSQSNDTKSSLKNVKSNDSSDIK